MELKMFQMLEFMNNRLSNSEQNINRIDEKLEFSLSLQRNHLIRVKNGEYIDDSNILMGRPYNDLSPQKALSIYNNPDLDYIILDVTKSDYVAPLKLDGVIKVSLEDLNTRYAEIQSKTTPILIFSVIKSLVVPASSETIALSSKRRLLKSELLPAPLGPIIARHSPLSA